MQKPTSTAKPLGELNPSDFRAHPVWTLYENDFDESQAIPIAIANPLDTADYSMVFVLCELLLNDGTTLEGIVSISLHSQAPYFIEFIKDDRVFRYGGVRNPATESANSLIKWLGKSSIEQVSPIKYSAPFLLDENVPIEGKINLDIW